MKNLAAFAYEGSKSTRKLLQERQTSRLAIAFEPGTKTPIGHVMNDGRVMMFDNLPASTRRNINARKRQRESRTQRATKAVA
ncbi:MAG: hypothetical protein ACRCV9_14465 [Burkholderiaceae bacterium]